jgi:hypothetical protein
VEPLAGGAIQENWRLVCRLGSSSDDETRSFVLRRNAAATIASSHSRQTSRQLSWIAPPASGSTATMRMEGSPVR